MPSLSGTDDPRETSGENRGKCPRGGLYVHLVLWEGGAEIGLTFRSFFRSRGVQGAKVRRSIEERIRRLEDALPSLKPKVRFLTRMTWEAGDEVLSTTISEGGKVLFSWRAEDSDADEKAAAYAAFLTTGRFEVLHLSVIYTRDPEARVYATGPADTPAPAPIAPAEATEGAQVVEAELIEDNPRASAEALRAELRRLRERWAMLIERGGDVSVN